LAFLFSWRRGDWFSILGAPWRSLFLGGSIADGIGLVSSDVPKAREGGECWYAQVVER